MTDFSAGRWVQPSPEPHEPLAWIFNLRMRGRRQNTNPEHFRSGVFPIGLKSAKVKSWNAAISLSGVLNTTSSRLAAFLSILSPNPKSAYGLGQNICPALSSIPFEDGGGATSRNGDGASWGQQSRWHLQKTTDRSMNLPLSWFRLGGDMLSLSADTAQRLPSLI